MIRTTFLLLIFLTVTLAAPAAPPNVILVMTDDQGYGDLAVHGNPIVKTPNLDSLHAESIRFTDFHVSPFCTPTRAALLTGRYAARTGAFRTSHGYSYIHPREVTMANVFAANGYRTAMFGKWHLGDNYPSRPMDKGFEHAVWHRCGGVTQISDYYPNDYFDDTYLVNGQWQKFEGYCTDVWFREALKFIEDKRDEPFFAYIATNAPHGPYLVAEQYKKMYEELGETGDYAAFKGMITNFDENLGKLVTRLDELGIADNTILVFLTDNGSSRGAVFENGLAGLTGLPTSGFNAGMRGRKSSAYDGGHRVPLFIRWPQGRLGQPRDIETLTAHIDLLPTLMDLCGLERRTGPTLDGRSLTPLLRNNAPQWPGRTLFSQIHGGAYFAGPGDPWIGSAVMTEQWRLVGGKELYDIREDPSQSHNLAADKPSLVKRLRAVHERWYETLTPVMLPSRIVIGHDDENPAELTSQDWQSSGPDVVWSRGHLENRKLTSNPWLVDVHQAGRYRFTLSRWPAYTGKPIDSTKARLKIQDIDTSKPIPDPQNATVQFEVDLKAGPTELQTWLTTPAGKTHGAYFVGVERLPEKPNIVFVFADDWGYGDLGSYGHTELETPNLDQLATEGTRFTQFYVSSGVCSPSRTSVITGHYPARHGVHGHFAGNDRNAERGMPNWLDPDVVSLPRLMQQAGYRTAHFGKWHLGGGGLPHGDPTGPKPAEYGYDETRVWNGNGRTWKGTELWPTVRYMDSDREWAPASSELAVDATIDFINRHRDEAFFVNLWLKDPHEPLWPTDAQRERYSDSFEDPKQCYYSVLSDADFHVGRLFKYLKDAGLDESTLVIFSSDNGPENLNDTTRAGITAGLKGRKRSLHEGGVRVPFIARWVGRVPAGAVDEESVLSTVDLLPTFTALAGTKLPADYKPDGENVSEIFSGKVHHRTKPLYWQWRTADRSGRSANWPGAAVRDGDWKLLVNPTGDRQELYNIVRDPEEQTNLATTERSILSRLKALLSTWQSEL